MTIDDLCLVNYCHRSCTPLLNIMRLSKEEAFALAQKMAEQNRETTAFYRFADFENYYPRRLQTDQLLHDRFLELGGKPVERHPLSFVLQGSEYLDDWFDCGIITTVPLAFVPGDFVSFTLGDSMAALERKGEATMLTKDMLLQAMAEYDGALEEYLAEVERKYHYIEVQLWNDDCIKGRTATILRNGTEELR